YPNNLTYRVDLGFLYAQSGRESKAKEQYRKTLNMMPADRSTISILANSLLEVKEYDLAVAAYMKGNEMFGSSTYFNYELAAIYYVKGKTTEMIEALLDYLIVNPKQQQSVKTAFQKWISAKKEQLELETQLYKRINKYPAVLIYPELLIWHFTHRKDFKNAFIQVKALDRRLRETGLRVLELARTASTEKEYQAAIMAYEYL
ncbi:MAG: hypothetical protein IH946_02505, partial [Bacteroidetes bacterium]|nr:hypothetical protein [Bacteroidota bacterium]